MYQKIDKVISYNGFNHEYSTVRTIELMSKYMAMIEDIQTDLQLKYIFNSASDMTNRTALYFISLKILIHILPDEEKSDALLIMGIFNGVDINVLFSKHLWSMRHDVLTIFTGHSEFSVITAAYRCILFNIQLNDDEYVLSQYLFNGIINDFVLEKIKIVNIINYLSPTAIMQYYWVKSIIPLNVDDRYMDWGVKMVAKISNNDYALLLSSKYSMLVYFLCNDFDFSFKIFEVSYFYFDIDIDNLYNTYDVSKLFFGMKPIRNKLRDVIGLFKY